MRSPRWRSLAGRWATARLSRYQGAAAGQRLRIDATRVRADYYWRWNTLPAWRGNRADSVTNLASRFRTAIRRRRGADARVFSLLSGGLDSRMIAAALREQRARWLPAIFRQRARRTRSIAGKRRGHRCRYSSLPLRRGRTPDLYAQLGDAWRAGVIDSGPRRSAALGVYRHRRQHRLPGRCSGTRLIGYFRSGRTRAGVEFFIKRMGWAHRAALPTRGSGADAGGAGRRGARAAAGFSVRIPPAVFTCSR